MTVVPYFPLVRRGAARHHQAAIQEDRRPRPGEPPGGVHLCDDVVAAIASRCKEVESGARNVDHILNGTLLPAIAGQFLACMAEGKPVTTAHVTVDASGGFLFDVH